MLRFFYNKDFKYTNRKIITLADNLPNKEINYANVDSPDTINGHIIYHLSAGETVPTYIVDLDNGRRYFVSGITQLNSKKFQLSLLRDIISENPELWKNEQAYISAGLANDYNKYKRWGLPFTNTKVKSERLNINGKSSFFVFYVNEQEFSGGSLTEQDLHIQSATIPGITGFDYRVSNMNEIPFFNIVNAGNVNFWENTKAQVRTIMDAGRPRQNTGSLVGGISLPAVYSPKRVTWYYDNGNFYYGNETNDGSNSIGIQAWLSKVNANENNSKTNFATAVANFTNNYKSNYGAQINEGQRNSLLAYINKVIYNTTEAKAYTIRMTQRQDIITENVNSTGDLTSALRACNFPAGGAGAGSAYYITPWQQQGAYYTFNCTRTVYNFTLEELGSGTSLDFNFVANARKLPKSAVRCVNIVASEGFEDSDVAQALMLAQTNGINPDNTTGRILDIQYLPFSVATETSENIKINNKPILAQFLDEDDYSYSIDLPDLTNINKETDTIKIVSPSRGSQFLFRPYDNDGSMIFDTKITLKPFASIIYIRPSTKGLLLTDWDDKDCLIISEDFSLTNVTSQWTEYIYNNKNYQNIFDRQIQGREFERSWERQVEDAQKKADEWTSRNISAQKAQTYTGNLPILSGIAGAIGTAWKDEGYLQASATDRAYNEALYQEGLSLSRDLFSMQLENIKAQPQIPSKITTIDVKFLDGVYLEYYSTNSSELNSIESFYKYNGNRVDAYGTFAQYWGWFVRGKIIISENYTQAEIDELNRRLNMGIFTEVSFND